MGKRVAPYIQKHLKEIQRKVHANKKHRVQRFRSPLFVLPEFADLPDYSLLASAEGDVSKTENWPMAMNRISHEKQAKIVFILPSEDAIGSEAIANAISLITESVWNVGVVFGKAETIGLAVSLDMFQLARGLDELLELPQEAIADLALRIELLGAKLNGKELLATQKSRNVEKGELLVNFGSSNFPNLYFEGR